MLHFAGALPPFGLLERKFITGFKPVMEIAITVTAVPSQEDLLLDAAAALQRELNGALEFRWLGQGEAMDLILRVEEKTPSPQPSPARGEGAGCGDCEGVPSPQRAEGQGEGGLR